MPIRSHLIFGTPLAINAGNAAYFLCELALYTMQVTPEQKNAIYEHYFVAMRSAHAGQALDVRGVHDQVLPALQTGDVSHVLDMVLAIYRLKSGAPVAALARIGARSIVRLSASSS